MADSRAGQRHFTAQQAHLLFETLDKNSEIDGNSSDDEPAASAASDTLSVSEQSTGMQAPHEKKAGNFFNRSFPARAILITKASPAVCSST
ncbi:hypothetical protein ElyMa_004226600 [Elysia marginata]|uniref:Uncharacterized protein n=1 Tax=Elysia marginata TaxID=1093978 RepID=A0AAV4GTA6_9GAST|nr:hypothetical protein ElyMa_004226600 [Elysia marginata]